MNSPTYAEKIKQRFDKRKGDRGVWDSHFEECAEYISPRRMGFIGQRTAGEKRMQRVLDETGIHANQLLASGLHGMATNPASKWFSLRIIGERMQDAEGQDIDINEVEEVRKWLSDAEQVIWQRLYQPGSGFTTALDEAYLDLGAFGTAVIFIGQRDDGGLLFQSRALSECYIDENADGVVDSLDREFEYTVRQLMQMEQLEGWTPSDKVRELYTQGKHDEKIKIVHSVHPREDSFREYGKKDAKNMRFASCYLEHATCHVLKESGFPEFPYLVPRWMKNPNEVYGRSPGMTALPSVKMLQAKALTYIKVLQKNADPTTWVRDDSLIGPRPVGLPGGVNYMRGDPNQSVMLSPVNVQGMVALNEAMEQLRNRIRNVFHVDVLQMVDQREMTLGEARMRLMERMRLMGPIIGRLETEMLGPLITRVMGVLERFGSLPPTPDTVAEREYVVEFVSPIANAQKQEDVHRFFDTLAPVVQLLGPQMAAPVIQKKINIDRAIDWLWQKNNLDPDLLNSKEEIAAAQQQEQAMQATQAAVPIADAANKSAGALKQVADAQAGGGVDLQQLLATMSQDPRMQKQLSGPVAQMGEQQQ